MWNTWISFRKGKKKSRELILFESQLLTNLCEVQRAIADSTYQHGIYRRIQIADKKRRDLAIASIRDRIVHRLLYDYLVKIFDKTFLFDVWSCRVGKGLQKCIERTRMLMQKNRHGYFWRSDITKFFDHVRHDVLLTAVRRCVTDSAMDKLITKVIVSYSRTDSVGGGALKVDREFPLEM
ncbi:MAG: reverse transcriptase domain-containing protein [Candidatus Magasanikbacteria bacterium]|nr:reverse transcriptase domain-containing protein [Candidatus Magasanikbacteria bacterium]